MVVTHTHTHTQGAELLRALRGWVDRVVRQAQPTGVVDLKRRRQTHAHGRPNARQRDVDATGALQHHEQGYMVGCCFADPVAARRRMKAACRPIKRANDRDTHVL